MQIDKDARCLGCGAVIDTNEGAAPDPGDVTVCVFCGHIMVFDENRVPRNPTSEECHEIAGNAKILALQKIRLEAKAILEGSSPPETQVLGPAIVSSDDGIRG